MARFFIDRPIFAIVIAILITMAGTIAGMNLPVAQYPHIALPRVVVNAVYPGADAMTLEDSVAQIMDQQVNGIQDMVNMESTSSNTGMYSLSVNFELGKDIDMAVVQTDGRVSQATARLPQAVANNGVTTKKVSPDTVMYLSLISPNQTYDALFLKNYGSINLVDDLKRVKGVGEVNEYGQDYAMRIWLQPDKMAQLGLTINDVMNAVRGQNIQAPAGTIGQQPAPAEQQRQYAAIVPDKMETKEQFEQILVRTSRDGTAVRLKDIGRVEMSGKDYFAFGDLNGLPNATFAIQLTPDANAIETSALCREVINNAAKRFPADMTYKIVNDSADFIKVSIKEVMKTLMEALVLVILIVFLFLQKWRATLIPMLAVPVSLIGTLGAFMVLGFSINTLTLFAMVLAIGLVVDDAIVVVEAVEHHMRYNGLSPRDATIRAMSEVSAPIVAIAFVLASVFIPVAFFGGTVGVLYKQFALTITMAMALSAFVALSLTPALCVLILKPHNDQSQNSFLGRFFDRFNLWFDRITVGYTETVRKILRRSKLAFLLLLVLVILTGALFYRLPTAFVPSEDQGFFLSAVNLPEATSLSRTRVVANQLAENIKKQEGVRDVLVITGFDLLGGGLKSSSALILTALKPWEERQSPELKAPALIRKAFAITNIPEAMTISFNVPSLPGVSSVGGMSMMLQDRSGKNLEELDSVTKAFLAAARKRPELTAVYTNFRMDTPNVRFLVDKDKVQTLGVPLGDVYSTLQTYFGGSQINDFNRFGRSFKVMMQADLPYRSSIEDLRSFYVRSQTGTMIPLSALVRSDMGSGPTTVKRFNGFRSAQIGATAAPGYSSGQAMKAMEEVAAEVLPSTFTYTWSGQSREEKISGGRAPIVFGLALVFAFLCLAALYESWSVPFAVLLAVPPAIFGSFLFQYIHGLENDVFMQIGLVMLIGLAAKNAILIVEFAKVRVEDGMGLVEAILDGARVRLRPILMTSFAFIFGCLPLAIASGAGAAARNSMGTAVVGGMLVATVLGVFLIPALYFVIYRLAHKNEERQEK